MVVSGAGGGVEGYKDAGFLSQGQSEHLAWGSPSPVCEQGLGCLAGVSGV